MSDTLADLPSWLPSESLTRHHHKTHNRLIFPAEFPFDFASSYSTESESDDDDDRFAGLTRRFTRSVSLQERPNIPYPLSLRKRVFSGEPESTLNSVVSGPTQALPSTSTPFVQADENSWDLIYATAGQVARMKMRMDNVNDNVYGNRGLVGPPRSLAPPPSYQHHRPTCGIRRVENAEFIRQMQFRQKLVGGVNYGAGCRCGVGRPLCFRQYGWPPLPVEIQRRQQPSNGFVVKPNPGGSGCGFGPRTAVVKRESAGTGVFLPRRYCSDPSEPKRKPACSPAQLPARVAQSFNKNMGPVITQSQPDVHGGFGPHYDMVMAGSNGVMLKRQWNNRHVGVPEATMEAVLPQEWTY